MDAASANGSDIILGPLAGRRFAVGVHQKLPLLCWTDVDAPHLASVPWTSAAIAFNLKGGDWVALSAQDIRVQNSVAMEPIKLRMFIPVTSGRLDAWKEFVPSHIFIGKMVVENGVPRLDGTPFSRLPLKLLSK